MSNKQLPELEDIDDYGVFVDGRFRSSSSSDRIEVTYPYTGDVWATVPNSTAKDVNTGVVAARYAFETEWQPLPPSERGELLRDIATIFETHSEELAKLETLQNGRLFTDHVHQMEALAKLFRYFAGFCDKIEGTVKPLENKNGQIFNYTVKEPYGVVGGITAWNGPLIMTARKLSAALAAGNTFVHKPSEYAPISALRFAELLYEETNLPDGVYNVIPGDGTTGSTLIDHDSVRKVSFGGRRELGRQVGKSAGENITPMTLELGGNNPNIIFPSADMENALAGAIKGVYIGSGQGCTATHRILAHKDIYDEFVERFVREAAEITLGDPMDPDTEMGPLVHQELRERVKNYIDRSVAAGATLLLGEDQPGDGDDGQFIAPTVVTDVEPDMDIVREEVFGPVATLQRFRTEDEAIEMANNTPYGLVAAVWTEEMRQAHRVVNRLEVGTIFVNESRRMSYGTPFGGYKDSGIGREHSFEGIEDFCQTKSIWYDTSGEVTDPFRVGTQ